MIDILNQDTDLSKHTKLQLLEIKMLIELCLLKCYFLWNEEIHLLKDSGPIGLSIMVVMAEGFLQVLEAKAMDDALHLQPPLCPLSFYRYVDDSHSRFNDLSGADKFHVILNNQHPKIKYTIEREEEKSLQFLDIKITNNGEGKYEFDVFRKDAITNVQVKPDSCHDPQILRGIFKGFLNRAISICSENYIDEEIKFLLNVFQQNGYEKEKLEKMIDEVRSKRPNNPTNTNPENEQKKENMRTITLPWIPGVSPKLRKAYRKAGYKVAFKSGRNIGNILTSKNKMKLPANSHPGVYAIPCSCGNTAYRGETKKKISTRANEHKKHVEKNENKKSGVAQHAKDCTGQIQFENVKTVAVIKNKFNRKVREGIEIQKHDCFYKDGGMNQDKGQYVTTKFWIPLLKYLKKNEIGQ